MAKTEYEFMATLANTNIIRKVLETIKEFMSTSAVQCQEDGIVIEGMDNSHVALLQLKWNKPAFREYYCKQHISLGVHFETLLKVVKLVDGDKSISLCKEPNKEVLRVIFGDVKDNSFFDIKLLDLEYDALDVEEPASDSCTSFVLNSSIFSNMITVFSNFGDSVNWKINKYGIKWTVRGDTGEGGRFVKNTTQTATSKFKLDLRQEVDEDFNLKYLQIFVKAAGLSDEVHMKIQPGEPMTVTFPIGNLEFGKMAFYLAPKSANTAEEN